MGREEADTGTAGSPRGTPGLGETGRLLRSCGRRACRGKPAFTGKGYFVRGLAGDTGFDCLPLLAAWAVFASALAGAGWCALSPPFAMVLTPFHLALRSAPARR